MKRTTAIVSLVMLGAPFVLIGEAGELYCNIADQREFLLTSGIGLVGSLMWLTAALLTFCEMTANVRSEYAKQRRAK